MAFTCDVAAFRGRRSCRESGLTKRRARTEGAHHDCSDTAYRDRVRGCWRRGRAVDAERRYRGAGLRSRQRRAKLPAGFCAAVVAEAIRPRGTWPSRRTATSTSRCRAGRGDAGGGVVALRDKDGDGQLETKETFGTGSITGIALRNGYLYVAKFNSVERFKMTPGQLKPAGERRRRSSAVCPACRSTATRGSRSTARARCT